MATAAGTSVDYAHALFGALISLRNQYRLMQGKKWTYREACARTAMHRRATAASIAIKPLAWEAIVRSPPPVARWQTCVQCARCFTEARAIFSRYYYYERLGRTACPLPSWRAIAPTPYHLHIRRRRRRSFAYPLRNFRYSVSVLGVGRTRHSAVDTVWVDCRATGELRRTWWIR